MQRGFRFRYLLWDSWYNNSSSLSFVFGTLRAKGIDLVAMVKRDGQKYLWGDKFMTIKELYRRSGKWQHNASTGIMYKSVVVAVLDKQSAANRNRRLYWATPGCVSSGIRNIRDTKH
jgi:hypothetical protein